MSAHPGTARFGVNTTIHPDKYKAGVDGMGKIITPEDGPVVETHFVYNPAQASRPMGTTRGGDPGKDFDKQHRQADYMANHDGYVAGDLHLMSLDERKVVQNTIYSVGCEWADPGYDDTSSNGWAPRQTVTAFD
jgi:hypothetical protein